MNYKDDDNNRIDTFSNAGMQLMWDTIRQPAHLLRGPFFWKVKTFNISTSYAAKTCKSHQSLENENITAKKQNKTS